MKNKILSLATALSAIALLKTQALAATTINATWSGAATGNWTDASWTIGGVSGQLLTTTLTQGDTYNINIAGANVTVASLSQNGSIFNLTGNGTGSLTVTGVTTMMGGVTGGGLSISGVNLIGTYMTYTGSPPPSLFSVFGNGTYTFSDPNSFRTVSYTFDTGGVNVIADAGAFTLTQTNNSASATELVDKLVGGYFKIDGTQVKATGTGYDGSVPASLAALNTSLLAQSINGKAFQVSYSAGKEVLTLIAAVPEPTISCLLGMILLTGLTIRRRETVESI